MAEEGFVPLLREVVDVACVSSEAHPVAVAANFLAFFCAMVGRGIFQRIGDAVIHCRPFFLIVGKSGKARKGTAEHTVREIFKRTDAKVREQLGNNDKLRTHSGGLSTGEGVGYAIRDSVAVSYTHLDVYKRQVQGIRRTARHQEAFMGD